MDARSMLSQLVLYEKKIMLKEEEINQLRNRLGGGKKSDVPVHVAYTKAQEHAYWDTLSEIAMAEDELTAIKNRSAEAIRSSMRIISEMTTAEYYDVIINRYFKHMSWSEVAKSIGYSKQHTFNLHSGALNELDQIILRVNKSK